MIMKRLFDVTVSSAALASMSPVLGLIAVAIKAHDGGPVFYRGLRIGRRGRPFRIYKFRSMVANAERLGGSSTGDSDDRITPVGKLIRRFKLDELPQFINVLTGDMSLVGPRPEVQKYVDMYTAEQRKLLELRPGITDWASIWNNDEGGVIERSGIADPEEAYERLLRPTKLELQLRYQKEQSLWTDLRILVRTAVAILDRDHDVSDLAPHPLEGVSGTGKTGGR